MYNFREFRKEEKNEKNTAECLTGATGCAKLEERKESEDTLMIHKKIPLRPDDPRVTLTTYIADERRIKRDALLVLPGGGYAYCSEREGEPIALAFMARGCNAFVLDYSVNEAALYPRPLADASLAMQHIREHADEYCIDPDRVFAIGFSAGGHLCGSLGSLWNAPELRAVLPDMPEGINKPTGTILCYPVLSAYVPGTHMGTMQLCLGTDEPTEEGKALFSIDRRISADTVPSFFMHTVADNVVPVQNSLVTMKAMADQGISFDARIYPHCAHGVALADFQTSFGDKNGEDAEIARWVDDAVYWMKHM